MLAMPWAHTKRASRRTSASWRPASTPQRASVHNATCLTNRRPWINWRSFAFIPNSNEHWAAPGSAPRSRRWQIARLPLGLAGGRDLQSPGVIRINEPDPFLAQSWTPTSWSGRRDRAHPRNLGQPQSGPRPGQASFWARCSACPDLSSRSVSTSVPLPSSLSSLGG